MRLRSSLNLISQLRASRPSQPLFRMTVDVLRERAEGVAAGYSTKSGPRDYNALRVNGPRLMDSIHSTCEFGKAHPYGEYVSDIHAWQPTDCLLR